MRDEEAEAIAWVGLQSQRVMTYSGAPFIVAGFASMVPAFLVSQQLFGNVKVSALLACAPALGFVVLGWKLSAHITKWVLPVLVRSAAKRFDVDEQPLKDLLLP